MANKDTSGYKGFWPMKFFEGVGADGQPQYREGFRSIENEHEVFIPENGWNGEPPHATGDLACARYHRVGSDEFWAAMAAVKDHHLGEVILQEAGRTVLRYD